MLLAAGEPQPSLSRTVFTSANTWKRKMGESTSTGQDRKQRLYFRSSQVISKLVPPKVLHMFIILITSKKK